MNPCAKALVAGLALAASVSALNFEEGVRNRRAKKCQRPPTIAIEGKGLSGGGGGGGGVSGERASLEINRDSALWGQITASLGVSSNVAVREDDSSSLIMSSIAGGALESSVADSVASILSSTSAWSSGYAREGRAERKVAESVSGEKESEEESEETSSEVSFSFSSSIATAWDQFVAIMYGGASSYTAEWRTFFTMSMETIWRAMQTSVVSSDHLMSASASWAAFVAQWSSFEYSAWLSMGELERASLLEGEQILSGMGLFGHLVVAARSTSLSGGIGEAFGLGDCKDEAPAALVEEEEEKDMFIRMAEALMPHDMASRMRMVTRGMRFMSNGREYMIDFISGSLVLSADYSPRAVLAAATAEGESEQPALSLKIRIGEAIDTILDEYVDCHCYRGALRQYYDDLRRWYRDERRRGTPPPRRPIQLGQRLPKSAVDRELEMARGPSRVVEKMRPYKRWLKHGVGMPGPQLKFKSKVARLRRMLKEHIVSDSEYEQLFRIAYVFDTWRIDDRDTRPLTEQLTEVIQRVRLPRMHRLPRRRAARMAARTRLSSQRKRARPSSRQATRTRTLSRVVPTRIAVTRSARKGRKRVTRTSTMASATTSATTSVATVTSRGGVNMFDLATGW